LAIGERLFASRGYRDVGVKDITDAAGLGPASFYTYFTGKDSFYGEILDGVERRAIQEIERYVSAFKSPLNRLKAVYRFTVRTLRENRILHGAYSGERRYCFSGLDARRSSGGDLFSFIEGLLEKILNEGTRKGIFRTNVYRNPKRVLMMIFKALLADGDPQSYEDLLADSALLVERGIKRWLRLRMRAERLDRRAARIP
jgi:AcrR family transcriptional regulator